VDIPDDSNLLVVPVRSRVKIRPRNLLCVRIVDLMRALVGIEVLGVEMMCLAYSADTTNRTSLIHVITRNQQPPAV
jgi:hypothetical protein